MPERLGVLGSLCNPPHVGHAALARTAAAQLALDRVLLIPTGAPPHRDAPAVPAAIRLRMAQAAAEAEPVLEASAIEVDRPGPSYMADTLDLLAAPGRQLVLLLGSDQFAALDGWHDPNRVRASATIAVAPRDGIAPGVAADVIIAMPRVDASSSAVRDRVAQGLPIADLVVPGVERIIRDEGLYR